METNHGCRATRSLVLRHVVAGGLIQNLSTDDIVFPSLTVFETIRYSADIRIPRESMTAKEKEAQCHSVIAELGLDKVTDSRIGGKDKRGISGGERKRVCIGVTFVPAPQPQTT